MVKASLDSPFSVSVFTEQELWLQLLQNKKELLSSKHPLYVMLKRFRTFIIKALLPVGNHQFLKLKMDLPSIHHLKNI